MSMTTDAPRGATQHHRRWARVLTASAIVAALTLVATPAVARPPTSGPGAAAIVQSWVNSSADTVPLRAGNNSFGEQHIRIGGSTRNTENHELTAFAKQQWAAAFRGAYVVGRFASARVYSHKYSTPGGRARTMCVIVDTADYTYAGTNYGYKGIITAFWINGHLSTETCNNRID